MGVYAPATQRLNGSMGFLQINGIDISEVTGIKVNVEPIYTDVQMGLDVGQKLVGRKGSGTLMLDKIMTRFAEMIDSLKQGKSYVVRLVAWVEDPDAIDGQTERIAISDVQFGALDIFNFTHGETVRQEIPFTFPVSSLDFLDRIEG